jgi:hypothetical protein
VITLIGPTVDGIEKGNELRDRLMKNMPLVLQNPHIPSLLEEQKEKIIDKLVWLANNEYRAQFYQNIVGAIASLDPGIPESPHKLWPTFLKWAGIKKLPKYKEPIPTIGNAKNGRVIRGTKGL